jgi:threonine dehydrogenase-like Zn-dependent dehydrogenase
VRLRLTHLLTYDLDGAGARERDAVARDEESGQRFFVPGRLPCGVCALCRRGLASVCADAVSTVPDPDTAGAAALELPDRFLTPIDEPAEAPRLDSEAAAAAGLVALAIQATAAANLTPGDVSIWLGSGSLPRTGAQLAGARGTRSLLVGDAFHGAPAVQCHPSVGDLPARLADEAAQAVATGHQRSTRRLFITRSDPGTLQAASQLADAGASLVVIGRGPVRLDALVLPPEARVAQVAGYHPDLVPEALAVLRRSEVTPPLGRLLAV